jgi:hypothetical protein
MKSHDYHVFMQTLIPLAYRDLLPKGIWDALMEIIYFFIDICSSKVQTHHIERLETNIIKTICKLEVIFPPSFFDSMEYLPIHLLYEAKVEGPIHYRWIYPFERLDITDAVIINVFSLFFLINYLFNSMHVLFQSKKKIKNKTHVETLICEAILLRRSQHLSHNISSLIWQRESTAFHGMMMEVKCLWVRTCQHSSILDDPHVKML